MSPPNTELNGVFSKAFMQTLMITNEVHEQPQHIWMEWTNFSIKSKALWEDYFWQSKKNTTNTFNSRKEKRRSIKHKTEHHHSQPTHTGELLVEIFIALFADGLTGFVWLARLDERKILKNQRWTWRNTKN